MTMELWLQSLLYDNGNKVLIFPCFFGISVIINEVYYLFLYSII